LATSVHPGACEVEISTSAFTVASLHGPAMGMTLRVFPDNSSMLRASADADVPEESSSVATGRERP
jgi:hypothetical protein